MKSRNGNRTCHQANPQCPVYPELAGLIRKTSGLADILRTATAGLGERVQATHPGLL